MKYVSLPAVNEPIYDDDNTMVIGFNLCFTVTCRGQEASATALYHLPPDETFPIAELNEKGSNAVWQGHLAMGTVEEAEAKLDALLEAAA